jgi:hypothetical protein
VLLTLLLVPTLIISGLVTDAARVYGAKSIISDAGMLAMNAGLTYYDSDLKDDYGLLALGTAIGDLDIEKYFINTIRASGIDGADNVSKLLDLSIDGALNVEGVPGSELYQTEVEKAQILEYMKYRAPVVIAGDLWEKLKEIKNNQNNIDALNAEADFTGDLEDQQDACEKAKAAINEYLKYEDECSYAMVQDSVYQTRNSMETGAFHIMLGCALWPMGDSETPTDFLDAYAKFTNSASHLKEEYPSGSLKDADARSLFKDYILCLGPYQYFIEDNNDDDALEAYITKKFEDNGFSYQTAEQNYNDYKDNYSIVSKYSQDCDAVGSREINQGNRIHSSFSALLSAQSALEKAVDAVNELKEAWEKTQSDYVKWGNAVGALSGDDENSFKASQEEDLKDYEDLFTEDIFDAFVQKMNDNITYTQNGVDYLGGFSFMGVGFTESIDTEKKIIQALEEYQFTAKSVSDVESKRDALMREQYVVSDKTLENTFTILRDDNFYKKLSELCTEEKKDSQEKIDSNKSKVSSIFGANTFAANEIQLNKELKALHNAKWSDDTPKPSELLKGKMAETPENDVDPSSSTDVTNKSQRKEAVTKAKTSLENIKTFLAKVDDIFTRNLENLYLMEYGIQMFSYYTVDKDSDGNTLTSGITSMSGDDLTAHAMYKSEAEYILWGKETAKENINSTRMLLYGIRFVFDLIYAFTDTDICAATRLIAVCLSFGIAFVVPIINFVLKVAVAAAEAAYDVQELMLGKSVSLIKDSSNSHIANVLGDILGISKKKSTNQQAFSMNYKEYLTIFLMIHMVGTLETTALARMADCIQLNTKSLDITKAYTMIAVSANVKVRTTFLRKASAWSGSNSITNDYYTISYKSCLGY